MTRVIWTAAIVFAAQSLVAAEDAYPIREKKVDVGDVFSIETSKTVSSTTKVTDAAGKVLSDQAGKTTETFVYKETVLAREAGKRPTRLRREYTKAEAREGDTNTPFPFQGKTLLIEKREGKYHYQGDDGKELTGAEVARLDEEFNQGDDEDDFDRLVLPGKDVAPGESWKIDMAPIVKKFGQSSHSEIDEAKATGKGELRKVYTKDDHRFGILHCQLDMPMLAMNLSSGKAILNPGSATTIGLDLDACIDARSANGTWKADVTMQSTEDLPMPNGAKAKLAMTIHIDHTRTVTELPKR